MADNASSPTMEVNSTALQWLAQNQENNLLKPHTRKEISMILARSNVGEIPPFKGHYLSLSKPVELYHYAIGIHGLIDPALAPDRLFWYGLVEILGIPNQQQRLFEIHEKFRSAMFEHPKRYGVVGIVGG